MATPSDFTMKQVEYGLYREVDMPFATAAERIREALAEEGFGVISEIDVAATMKKKLNADFPPYLILGACNPLLAREALLAEPDIGLLLPCNVVVSAGPGPLVTVSALRPTVLFDRLVRDARVEHLAREIEERLSRALARLPRAR